MIRRPPRSTQSRSSAASDVYKRQLYEHVVNCFKDAEKRKKEIEQQAAAESTQWEGVIEIFNDRFFVPFRLIATNRDRVVLGQEKLLKLGFEFEEGVERTPVERGDLLEICLLYTSPSPRDGLLSRMPS